MPGKQQVKNALMFSCNTVVQMSALFLWLLPIYPGRTLTGTTAVQECRPLFEQFGSCFLPLLTSTVSYYALI
ncbi:hypothetical protein JD844_023348 [Phrynosoma platyrhinos]|uniref:Uncharacterized protein n=1 Tax=Phrynosoma platyrhinos TaxID=52577 RepID=A0ABQ7SWU0_PHRPL|nr:hypothetical protein JD844_023348 [Phrynosoma platyrhinos]